MAAYKIHSAGGASGNAMKSISLILSIGVVVLSGCGKPESTADKLEADKDQKTNTMTFEWEPAFSPDQAKIIYASAR
jgi:hypothetical protein